MSKFKRPLCWLTRHHWLLIDDTEHSVFLPERDDIFMYTYECQVCQKLMFQEVVHILAAPKDIK